MQSEVDFVDIILLLRHEITKKRILELFRVQKYKSEEIVHLGTNLEALFHIPLTAVENIFS
jgi:hypothetical protein